MSKTLYLLLDTGSTQEDRYSSQHDLKIIDRGCKASNQINKNRLCLCGLSLTLIQWHLIWVYNVCKSTLQGFWAYTMLEEMHDPVLSQPIFVKAMSSQVRATSFVIWKMCMFRCVWSFLLLVQCSPVLPVTFLHSLLWTSWKTCMSCSLDTEKGTSMTLLYHRIALVSVANKTCTTFSYIFDRKC